MRAAYALAARVLWMMPVLVAVSIITFGLMHLVPGGPFAAAFEGRYVPPEIIQQIERQYGLDRPVWEQYLLYVGQLLRGNLGSSLVEFRPVSEMIREGLPISAALGGYAAVIGVVLGLGLGVAAALGRNLWIDHVASIVAVLGVAVPSYILGMLLIIAFSLKLGWLPAGGWTGPLSWLLPVLALAVEPVAVIARYARMSVLDVLGEVYVTVARAKGLRKARILIRHVVRNALNPVVTAFGLVVPRLIVGSFLVETVFAIPGSGRLFVAAVSRRDYPVIMAVALLYATVVVTANLLVDLAYRWLDPRIRYA